MFASRYVPESSRKRSYESSESESESGSDSDSDGGEQIEKPLEVEQEDSDNNDDETSQPSDKEEKDSESESEDESVSSNKSEDSESESENMPNEVDDSNQTKHSSIFKRLKASLDILKKLVDIDQDQEEMSDDGSRAVEPAELVPIPQPELPKDKRVYLSSNVNGGNLDYIAKPVYYASTTTKPFDTLFNEIFGLSPNKYQQLVSNLKSNNFESAFSVQLAVFNELVSKNKCFTSPINSPNNNNGDLLVNAATGSGKTLAYLIPILMSLSNRIVPKLSCIILVPTRPLVNQVLATVNSLTKNLGLNVIASNSNLSIKKEMEKFQNFKPDILISTPGRLVDYLTYNDKNDDYETQLTGYKLNLRYLQFLVIDEVDRLLNQSFQNWINIVNKKIESDKLPVAHNEVFNYSIQKLLFSATLHNDVNKLSSFNFYKPKLLVVDDDKFANNDANTGLDSSFYKVPENLQEFEIFVNKEFESFKPLLLLKSLIENHSFKNILVFTKSNESSLRLTKLLNLLYTNYQRFYSQELPQAIEIHYLNSTVSGNNKKKILNRFTSDKINILVVTDLVSRGLDLTNVEKVINYDLPISSTDYVHRIGRCARAYNYGEAITMICGNGDRKWFNKITKPIKRKNEIKKLLFNQEKESEGAKLVLTELENKFYNDSLAQLQDAVLSRC